MMVITVTCVLQIVSETSSSPFLAVVVTVLTVITVMVFIHYYLGIEGQFKHMLAQHHSLSKQKGTLEMI